MTPASWIIREKSTGKIVLETCSAGIVRLINAAKYEVTMKEIGE